MSQFIEVTGYKGEKITVNVSRIRTVAQFMVPEEDKDSVPDPRILNVNAVVTLDDDGNIPVTDTYESIVRRLEV